MISIHRSHIILFLISPFLLLLANIKKYRSKYFPGVLYLFILFYGFTFTVASDAFDAARIIQKFADAKDVSFAKYSGISEIFKTGNTQIVENIIIWFVANYFQSKSILFLIYAAIFGFFYVKNYQIVVKFFNKKNTFFQLILLITFMMIIPIWEINGWRMWTASQIFIFSVFSIMLNKIKIKYLFLLFLTPFIHFSFWMMIIPTILFLLFNKFLNQKLLYGLFVITLFINPFNVDKSSIENSVKLEFAQSKIAGYGNEEFLESSIKKESQLTFHAKYYKTALHFGLVIPFIAMLFFNKILLTQNQAIIKWTLFFGVLVNVIALLPFGDMLRFRLIHYFFIIFCLLALLNSQIKIPYNKLLNHAITILLLFFNLVELRKGLDRFGIATIITNPITVGFLPEKDNIALINLVK